jgi:glyoxylase-like metal-dependent hydrolase (beta-lactamase superfamily II)
MDMEKVLQFSDFPDLFLVPLRIAADRLRGFDHFLGSWVVRGEDKSSAILVDVGPSSTTPQLVSALDTIGIEHVSAVLLTHIHIDHAGGIGSLVEHATALFDKSSCIVCHPKGHRHLLDPQKLELASRMTLGDKMSDAYGSIPSLRSHEEILLDASTPSGVLSRLGIHSLLTPGHAAHHVSFVLHSDRKKYLFAGEAAGVILQRSPLIVRPATPPPFRLGTMLDSLRKLQEIQCDCLCYGHFGMTTEAEKALSVAHKQLEDWHTIIQKWVASCPSVMKGRIEENEVIDDVISLLLREDPVLLRLSDSLSPDDRERERHFLRNSAKGYIQYILKENTEGK